MGNLLKIPSFISDFIHDNVQYSRHMQYSMIIVTSTMCYALYYMILLIIAILVIDLLACTALRKVHSQTTKDIIFYIAQIPVNIILLIIASTLILFPCMFFGIGRLSLVLCILLTFVTATVFLKLISLHRIWLHKRTLMPANYYQNMTCPNPPNEPKTRAWPIFNGLILFYFAFFDPIHT